MSVNKKCPIESVLFDTGGVLTSDVWETLLLTPGFGLADRLGLDQQVVKRKAEALWRKYSTIRSSETDYWREFESSLSIRIPHRDIVNTEEHLLKANIDIPQVISLCSEKRLQMGIVSDATSFWFPRQMKVAGIERYLEKKLIFLSYKYGRLKTETQNGLFSIVAERTNPTSTLVIDDRRANILIASSYGFRTVLYNMDSFKHTLSEVISQALVATH